MMKKSIFAVAVASVLTLGAAHAETVLYGSIRYEYQSKKLESPDRDTMSGIQKFTGKRLSNLEDAGSRIGLKGSEDLGNNNAVIYNLEWGFNGMEQGNSASGFKNRKAILGLTGDWGTVTAGRQDNPFKVTIVDDSVQDDFNGSTISSASQRAMTTTLRAQGLSGDQTIEGKTQFVNTVNDTDFSRVGKVIAYTTPEWAGFQANAAVMMDADLYPTNSRKNADLWTINARYAYDLGGDYGQILAKAGYIQGKVSGRQHMKKSSKVWGLFVGYLSDPVKVTVSYADGNQNDLAGQSGDKAKSKGWDLGASYSFGPNYFSTVRATYGQNELKVAGGKDKVKSWAVGFEQKLSTRTRAWVEYGAEETKFNANNTEKQKDNIVSIGLRHDF
ncbi:porin [Ignatzschineria ureiclastica]|uniref:Porin n=1 Tax=Ignatzschineria ureiclastica TaxID=472582 RepID=A0A2U2AEK4_9GAMM|nr:porin [Ignatzschineria ureiclastica]PWD81096.1 porin [Ignatzschineria ureiclastica]GGZ96206.1 porin [Ignatzschineria ureiclastica]